MESIKIFESPDEIKSGAIYQFKIKDRYVEHQKGDLIKCQRDIFKTYRFIQKESCSI